jgi:hypothetical protein
MTDLLADDFRVGDPVIDLATGRAMVVVDVPGETVAEWSDREGYDLTENYANERTRADPNDPVIEAVYTASVQSEPNGPRSSDEGGYTFPSSRLGRPTIESIEGVRRVFDEVAVDVVRRLAVAAESDAVTTDVSGPAVLRQILAESDLERDTVHAGLELADVDRRADDG